MLGLAAVLAIAAVLRICRLGDVPPGLFCDEAASGYNAYAILHTGHDEEGTFLPLFVWSFQAYKYPLYIYPSMVWVGLLGLTELATRLQSAVYGVGTVAVVYGIGSRVTGCRVAGLAAAVALAVLPWHLHFSRIAFSLTGFTFWFGLAVYFFVRALDESATRRDWVLCGACFALCFYVYAVAQIIVPAFLAAALPVYLPAARRRRRWALTGLATAIITATPFLVFYAIHHQAAGRYAEQVWTLKDVTSWREVVDVVFRQNYLTYFGPDFLLHRGDPILRHGVANHGVLYASLVPWILIGIGTLFIRPDRPGMLVLVWLVVYPLGAALTRETPSATRAFIGTVPFALLAGIGFERMLASVRRMRSPPLRRAAVAAVVAVAVLPLAAQTRQYLRRYFIEYPSYAAAGIEGFQYGYREAIRTLEAWRQPGDTAAYSTTSVNNPYIFYLFYTAKPGAHRSRADIPVVEVLPWQVDEPPARGDYLLAALPHDMWYFGSWEDRLDIDAPGQVPVFHVLRNPKPKRFIHRWELFGPFPNTLAPEYRTKTSFVAQAADASEVLVNWETYEAKGGVVDLNAYFGSRLKLPDGNPELIEAFLRTTVWSPDARRVRLELFGSRDEVEVWLNSARVTRQLLALTEMEARHVDLELAPGSNEILVDSRETIGDWWLVARIARPDGSDDDAVIIRRDEGTRGS